MPTAQQQLMDGVAACKRKDYATAERLLVAAFHAYPPNDGAIPADSLLWAADHKALQLLFTAAP
jgi:hypothetical protein